MKMLIMVGLLCMISCQKRREVSFESITLTTLEGQNVPIKTASTENILVFIFMSPDCPLCISYTKTIMDLHETFHSKNIGFYPVYAGTFHSVEEIMKFQSDYAFNLTGYIDPQYRFCNLVSATITPQAVVMNREGKILYTGAIDDWMYNTGKKKAVIRHHYLQDAIQSILSGQEVVPAQTEPIGCFIEL